MRHPGSTIPLTRRQQQLVEKNWLLIFAGMKRHKGLLRIFGRDEMERAFGYALCRAASTFKPERSSFSTWAFWWFRGAISVMSRERRRHGLAGSHADDCHFIDLSAPFHRQPNHNGDPLTLDGMQEYSSRSRAREDDNHHDGDLAELREAYATLSPLLDERQAEVLQARMEGYTLNEIGQRLGITRERVRQVQYAAIHKLQEASNGPTRSAPVTITKKSIRRNYRRRKHLTGAKKATARSGPLRPVRLS